MRQLKIYTGYCKILWDRGWLQTHPFKRERLLQRLYLLVDVVWQERERLPSVVPTQTELC